MLGNLSYEHTMMGATALAYIAGIVGNKWAKPWIEAKHIGWRRLPFLRIPIGRIAVGLVGMTWWVFPVYAVGSYATGRICNDAALRLNDVPEGCGSLSDAVAKTLDVTRFEGDRKTATDDLPILTAADFEEPDASILGEDELEKIQRFVLKVQPGYYNETDETKRAKIWNAAVKKMGLDKKYLRDESEIVAEDARD